MAKSYRHSNKGEGKKRAVGLWLLAVFCLLPVVFTDTYFNMLITKFLTFCIVTAGMLFAVLYFSLRDKSLSSSFSFFMQGVKEEGFIAQAKKSFSPSDLSVIAFISVCIISTALSHPYTLEAFIGHEGRYNGLILMLLYSVSFFVVSRNYRFDKRQMTAFLGVGIFVCVFGIFQYFNINLFYFKSGLRDWQWDMFTSTIGNINTYTAYVGYILAFSGVLFITTPRKSEESLPGESLYRIVFYGITMGIAFAAIIMGKSDNAYLTLGAFFGFLPFGVFTNRRNIRRYILSLAVFISIVKVITMLNDALPGRVLGIDGIFNYIADFSYLWILLGFLYLVVILLYWIDFSQKKQDAPVGKPPRVLWSVFCCAAFFAIVYVAWQINRDTDITYSRWGSLRNYFVFDDKWGTYRGYIWRAAMEEFGRLPLWRKLFGSGPDTFGIYMVINRYEDMVSATGQFYDSAHNEYIQFLFTLGILGLISYLGIIAGSIFAGISSLKNEKIDERKRPYILAAIFLIICYATQALVNLNLPILTPIFWAFLMILNGIEREEEGKILRKENESGKKCKKKTREEVGRKVGKNPKEKH